MKIVIRVVALTLVIAAAVAGNSTSKNVSVAAVHAGSLPGGGPVPMCNPFNQVCSPIR